MLASRLPHRFRTCSCMICWLQHKPCVVPGLTSILGPSLGAFSADTTLVLILLWGSSKRQSHIGDDGSKVQVIFFLTGPVRKERDTVCMRRTPANERGRGYKRNEVAFNRGSACMRACRVLTLSRYYESQVDTCKKYQL